MKMKYWVRRGSPESAPAFCNSHWNLAVVDWIVEMKNFCSEFAGSFGLRFSVDQISSHSTGQLLYSPLVTAQQNYSFVIPNYNGHQLTSRGYHLELLVPRGTRSCLMTNLSSALRIIIQVSMSRLDFQVSVQYPCCCSIPVSRLNFHVLA